MISRHPKYRWAAHAHRTGRANQKISTLIHTALDEGINFIDCVDIHLARSLLSLNLVINGVELILSARCIWPFVHGRPEWATALVQLAEQALALYATEIDFLDYAYLQAEVTRDSPCSPCSKQNINSCSWKRFASYVVSYTSRNPETLYGVGQGGVAVYSSFIGDPKRFADHASFRGWSGMILRNSQSATS